ncbi:MAG: choice-of-anchor D domain-containing protein [Candidatus Glassbacteria bacterium]|nr:choice-of-anchor D domain-containing protein [Candidatus Glassbacteria bacterium]
MSGRKLDKITETIPWAIALAALLMVAVNPAAAYVYFFTREDGYRQHWDPDIDFPLRYAIHDGNTNDGLSNSVVVTGIRSSFQAWNNIAYANLDFDYAGTTSQTNVSTGNDNINLVIFDSWATDFSISDGPAGPSVVGITINTYSATNGRILDSDIIFNDLEYVFSTTQPTDLSQKRINLQDVATHEIGHMLGLDHTWIEHATMYPYTRDGQSSVSEDDRAGISSLYPAPGFSSAYDSLTGTVYNVDGDKVWGVYVSAINDSTGIEEVAALSDSAGRYNIQGLRRSTEYYLRARTVDLKHVGQYIQSNSDLTVYIPQYFDGVSSIFGAVPVPTGGFQPDYDFTLTTATLLARYDMSSSLNVLLYLSGNTTNHYLAVRFPASSLPVAFKVHGMTFHNNDLNTAWPKIMLTSGTESAPDAANPIRQVVNYLGAEQSFTNIEWEPVQLTDSRPIWIVFQFPDKQFQTNGDGPALGATTKNIYSDIFYSTTGINGFAPYPFDNQYDLAVYLTTEITDIALVPAVELDVDSIDFGHAKVGRTTYQTYPIGNTGASTLELLNMYSSNLAYTVSADNSQVGPGMVDTLRVAFRPASAALWRGTITIETNDPVREVIQIPVAGTGVHPSVQLATTAVAFDSVEVGESDSAGVTIRSTGEVPLLAWGWNVDSGHYGVSTADTLEIAPGDSASVTVRFAPLEGGEHPAVFSFTTDDSARTLHQVALSGTATVGGVVLRCDMTGDGRADIIDVLFFLLLSRRSPADPRLDWNADGSYTIADVVALLRDIRDGACPDVRSGAVLAGQRATDGNAWLESLSAEEVSWLRDYLASAGLGEDDYREAMAALGSADAGRPALPNAFSLAQNHPNPFNPSTTISFSVPDGGTEGRVSLKVYDIGGRLVRVLAEGERAPGEHTVFWDGTDERGRGVPSGVYIYRLLAGGRAFTRKMVLLK